VLWHPTHTRQQNNRNLLPQRQSNHNPVKGLLAEETGHERRVDEHASVADHLHVPTGHSTETSDRHVGEAPTALAREIVVAIGEHRPGSVHAPTVQLLRHGVKKGTDEFRQEADATAHAIPMPWSREWLNSRGSECSIQLQVLASQLQEFLDRVWEGDRATFLNRVVAEHEQLRRQIQHKELADTLLTRSFKEVTTLALMEADELMSEPEMITRDAIGKLLAYTSQLERTTFAMMKVVGELKLDLQMAEDVGTLATMARECEAKREREEEARETAGGSHRLQQGGGEAPIGWRAAAGYFHLVENWYSTAQVTRLTPGVDVERCTCNGRCRTNCAKLQAEEECDEADVDCGNQRFQRHRDRLRVQHNEQKGAALHVTHHHAKDALVVEYRGEVLTRAAMQKRVDMLGPKAWEYSMTLDVEGSRESEHLVLDATHYGSLARFANHDCGGGNCYAARRKVKGRWRIGLFAREGLAAGAEVTYDYAGGRGGQMRFECACGHAQCRTRAESVIQGEVAEDNIHSDGDVDMETGDPEQREASVERDGEQRQDSSGRLSEGSPVLPVRGGAAWMATITQEWHPWTWPATLHSLKHHVLEHVYNTFIAWMVRNHTRISKWAEVLEVLQGIEQTGDYPGPIRLTEHDHPGVIEDDEMAETYADGLMDCMPEFHVRVVDMYAQGLTRAWPKEAVIRLRRWIQDHQVGCEWILVKSAALQERRGLLDTHKIDTADKAMTWIRGRPTRTAAQVWADMKNMIPARQRREAIGAWVDANPAATAQDLGDHVMGVWDHACGSGPRWPVIRAELSRAIARAGDYDPLQLPTILNALRQVVTTSTFVTMREWGLRKGRDVETWREVTETLEQVCSGGAKPTGRSAGGALMDPISTGQGDLYSRAVIALMEGKSAHEGQRLYQDAIIGVWTVVGRQQLTNVIRQQLQTDTPWDQIHTWAMEAFGGAERRMSEDRVSDSQPSQPPPDREPSPEPLAPPAIPEEQRTLPRVSPAVWERRAAMGMVWGAHIESMGEYTTQAMEDVLGEMERDQSIGEWDSFITRMKLHPPGHWDGLRHELVRETQAHIMQGVDYLGAAEDARVTFTGGAYCTRREHDDMEHTLTQQRGLLAHPAPGHMEAFWHAAIPEPHDGNVRKMERLRKRVLGSIRGTVDNDRAKSEGYDAAVGGCIRAYLQHIAAGLNTAHVHPICAYHLSKVLGGSIEIWTPHMAVPMRFTWSDAEAGTTAVSMAWVHKARHGGLNHFWRLAPLHHPIPRQESSDEEGAIRQNEEEEDQGQVRDNDRWDWEARRNPLRPNLLERLIEQYPNTATVCRTEDKSLTISEQHHISLEEASGRSVRRRTYDSGLTSLRPQIRLMDELMWHLLASWAKRMGYGYGTTTPDREGRQIWVGEPYLYNNEINISRTERRRRAARREGVDMGTAELLLLPVNIDNVHYVTVRVWVRRGLVQILDSTGGEQARIARQVCHWLHCLEASQNLPETAWRTEHCPQVRQLNGSDCGVFTTADIMATPDGDDLLTQAGTDRCRRWFTHLLWSAGYLTLRTDNGRARPGTVPRQLGLDEWEADTVAVHFQTSGTETMDTASEDENDGGGGGGSGAGGSEPRVDLDSPDGTPTTPETGAQQERKARGPPGGFSAGKQATLDNMWAGAIEAAAMAAQVQDLEDDPRPPVRGGRREPEDRWVRDRRRPGSTVIREGNWELGGEWWGGIAGYVTWNIGPLGWYRSTDDLLHLLESRPTAVTLQDIRMSPSGLKGVKGWLRTNAPQYLPFLSSARHTRLNEEGEEVRYWVGVITLIHKEARPRLTALDLEDNCISHEDASWATGRVLVNSIPGRTKQDRGTVVINVYQHQADDDADQERLLDILARYIRRLKGRFTTIILSGDFNAALRGARWGYAGDYETVDTRLTSFYESQDFMDYEGTGVHTWTPYNGRQQGAELDYVWVWTAGKEGEYRVAARQAWGERHDHRVLVSTMSAALLPPVQDVQAPPSKLRLQMRKYPEHEVALQDYLTSIVQEQEAGTGGVGDEGQEQQVEAQVLPPEGDGETSSSEDGERTAIERTEALLTKAGEWLANHIGTDKPIRQGGARFNSVEMKQLNSSLRVLQRAHHHALEMLNGAQFERTSLIRDANKILVARGREPCGDWEGRKALFAECRREVLKEQTKLMDQMRREQIDAFKAKCRARFKQPGAKEIARFLGKRAGRLDLWGLLPKEEERRYPSIVQVRGLHWERCVAAVLDTGMTDILSRATTQPTGEWVTLLGVKTGDRLRVNPQEDGSVKLQFFPLTRLTEVLTEMEDRGCGADVLGFETATDEIPWTQATDKLSQAEYYYAREATDTSRGCAGCDASVTVMYPLSHQRGGERSQQWWCTQCHGFHSHYGRGVTDDPLMEGVCSSRRLAPEPFLGVQLMWEDFEFHLQHLPRHKSAGNDGVPYEVLRGASLPVRRLLHQCVQEILQGQEIPRHWAKGIVRLLEKREPVYQLENLRPVTLLRTVYKLATGIVNNRLQWELEERGILEPTQEGFRPGRHTRRAVARLQYFIEDSKRKGQEVYIAYIDWFAAFCSVPHSRLMQMLEWTGMHTDDIAVLERLQEHAHLLVDTDFGTTCEIPITRGTPQGDTLSPTLFCMFINVCLRYLAGAGVGHQHECGVRTNACAFADDIALMTNSVADMNKLLARLRRFSEWSGMEVNLSKCEVTGFCFKRNREQRTDAIKYDGRSLRELKGKAAFKYLGVRVAANGSTKAEREHVLAAATKVAKASVWHPYHPYQMEEILRTAVRPAFRYSSPLTAWSRKQLRELEQVWARIHKNSWRLTSGHHTAPFILGAGEGGIADMSIFTLRAKECATVLSAFGTHGDPEMLQLMQQEYEWLCQDWGTKDPWQLQLCLLMTDQADASPTLLSQTMLALGQVGLTLQWDKIKMPMVDVDEDPGIITLLEAGIWDRVQAAWAKGKGDRKLEQCAQAIKGLARQGITEWRALVRDEEWCIEPHLLPIAQARALMSMLEDKGPVMRRRSVHALLRSERIPEEERIELVIQARPPARRQRSQRAAIPEQFDGLGPWVEGGVTDHRIRDGEVEYRVRVQTGAASVPTSAEGASSLEGKLLLLPHDIFPACQADWPTTSPTQVGWWVRVTEVYNSRKGKVIVVEYLDESEKGLTDWWMLDQILPVVQRHSELPETMPIWVQASHLGDTRLAVGSKLPRMVQTYWEEEQRRGGVPPPSVRQALDQREERRGRNRQGRREQQGLDFPEWGPQRQVISWESEQHHTRARGPTLDPSTCILHMEGQAHEVHEFMSSTAEGLPIRAELRHKQGTTSLHHGDITVWKGERAKAQQWIHREGF